MIVCDLDGTLTPSRKPVSGEILSCVKEFINRDLKFCILAGGTLSLIKEQFLNYFDGDSLFHIFCVSGTKHYVYNNGDIRCIGIGKGKYFNKTEKNKIKHTIMNFVNINNIEPLTSYSDQIEFRGTQITFSALGRNAPLKQKTQFDPNKTIRKKWVKYFRKKLKDMGLEIHIGGTTSIDFTKKGLNKLYGIKVIKNLFDLTQEDILFFGDSFGEDGNDSPVLGYVDCVEVENEKETLQIFKQMLETNTIPQDNLKGGIEYMVKTDG